MKRSICIILGSLYPYVRGGDELLFTDIANRITQQTDWEFSILCRKPRNILEIAIENHLDFYPLKSLRSQSFGRMFEFIYMSFIDIVYFSKQVAKLRNSFLSDFDALIVSDPMITYELVKHSDRPPVIQFIGGTWADNVGATQRFLKGIVRKIEKTAYEKADHIVVMDKLQSKRLDPQRSQFTIIPSGIDSDLYDVSKYNRDKLREKYEYNEKKVFLTVATLRGGIKGHKFLINALPRILKLDDRCHFYFAGKGSKESLEQLAKSLDVLDNVHFLGERSDIPELLISSDYFILPSLSEGTPRALLEGMASGLPCIATDVGGIPEIITHEDNGLLIPPQNSEAIADAIEYLLNHPDEVARLGNNARQHVLHNYDLSITASKYISLLESI
ncbi:MAG: glycosyltransferase family 4 protein [Candidatus Thorarchaeota archaeon]